MRTYRLLRLGVSISEIDAAPARLCDWLLAIDETVNAVQNEQTKAASSEEGAGPGRRIVRTNNRELEA